MGLLDLLVQITEPLAVGNQGPCAKINRNKF